MKTQNVAIICLSLIVCLFIWRVTISEGAKTKAAWDRMCDIDVSLLAFRDDPVRYWDESVRQYSTINFNYIDEDLRQYVRDYIKFSVQMHYVNQAYFKKLQQISQGIDDAVDIGGGIGSLDPDDPDGTAIAGAILGGLLGGAIAEAAEEELQKQFDAQLKQVQSDFPDIYYQRREKLAYELSKKYSMPFNCSN